MKSSLCVIHPNFELSESVSIILTDLNDSWLGSDVVDFCTRWEETSCEVQEEFGWDLPLGTLYKKKIRMTFDSYVKLVEDWIAVSR